MPWYQAHFANSRFQATDLHSTGDLVHVPVLSRFDVVNEFDRLHSRSPLLRGKPLFMARTTGSTGLPVRVSLTGYAKSLFPLLWLRQARWARLDLQQKFARIRIPVHLFTHDDGRELGVGESITRPGWVYGGAYFETGEEVHYNLYSPRNAQLAWLRQERPGYLMSYPTLLEELALASEAEPLEGLTRLFAVSSMLTQSMRARIDQTFGVPIHQNYGLNEVGIVATRCHAGRYHVNTEHAWVEIVDAEDQPVPAGGQGRLLVTSLSNQAMPLFRYDTGDIATSARGDCPCVRSLPSFEDILGRHVRYAGTPEETRPRLNALMLTLSAMPNALFENIRQYQVRQTRERDFEVHVVTAGPIHPGFAEKLQAAWDGLSQQWGERELRVLEVDAIEATPSGKQLDFVSAFSELEKEYQQRSGEEMH